MKLMGSATFKPGNVSIIAAEKAAAVATVTEVTEHVLQQAQIIVPIDTGFLYNSGYTEIEETDTGAIGTVGFSADYAGYVEFGTRKMEAQPYLRPALDAANQLLLDTAAQKSREALNV